MISQDEEGVTEKVMSPFTHRRSDCVQLANISGSLLQARAKLFAKEGDRFGVLKQDDANGCARSIGV